MSQPLWICVIVSLLPQLQLSLVSLVLFLFCTSFPLLVHWLTMETKLLATQCLYAFRYQFALKYTLHQELSFDEAIIPFQGHLVYEGYASKIGDKNIRLC